MVDLKSYFSELNQKQKDYFNEGITLSIEFRKSQVLLQIDLLIYFKS